MCEIYGLTDALFELPELFDMLSDMLSVLPELCSDAMTNGD
jgi:hypothetical protein